MIKEALLFPLEESNDSEGWMDIFFMCPARSAVRGDRRHGFQALLVESVVVVTGLS